MKGAAPFGGKGAAVAPHDWGESELRCIQAKISLVKRVYLSVTLAQTPSENSQEESSEWSVSVDAEPWPREQGSTMTGNIDNLLHETRRFEPSEEFRANAVASAELYEQASADRPAFWGEQSRALL